MNIKVVKKYIQSVIRSIKNKEYRYEREKDIMSRKTNERNNSRLYKSSLYSFAIILGTMILAHPTFSFGFPALILGLSAGAGIKINELYNFRDQNKRSNHYNKYTNTDLIEGMYDRRVKKAVSENKREILRKVERKLGYSYKESSNESTNKKTGEIIKGIDDLSVKYALKQIKDEVDNKNKNSYLKGINSLLINSFCAMGSFIPLLRFHYFEDTLMIVKIYLYSVVGISSVATAIASKIILSKEEDDRNKAFKNIKAQYNCDDKLNFDCDLMERMIGREIIIAAERVTEIVKEGTKYINPDDRQFISNYSGRIYYIDNYMNNTNQVDEREPVKVRAKRRRH